MDTFLEQSEEQIDETGTWLSIGDLMAGLLMVFALFLIVTLARLYEYQEQSKSNRIVIIEEIQKGLDEAGIKSKVDLQTGSLALTEGLNFAENSSAINDASRLFLKKLIPIYSQAIFLNDGTSEEVLHLVIEGHADTGGRQRKSYVSESEQSRGCNYLY